MSIAEHSDQRPPGNAYEALMAATRNIDARKYPAENLVHAPEKPEPQNSRKDALKAALRALDGFKNRKGADEPETIHAYLQRVKAEALAASGAVEVTNEAEVFKNEVFKDPEENIIEESEILFAGEKTEEIIDMSGTADISSVLAILNDTFKNFNEQAPHIEIIDEEEVSEENIPFAFPQENVVTVENPVTDPEIQRDLTVACALFFHEPSLAAQTQANIAPERFAQLLHGR